MKKEKILKNIDYIRDIKNHLWTIFLIVFGGSLTLSFNLNNPYKIFLMIIGFILAIVLFLAYFKKDDQFENLLNELE